MSNRKIELREGMEESLGLIPPLISKVLKEKVRLDVLHVEEAKSAQQRVLILQYANGDEDSSTTTSSSPWGHILRSGDDRLVVRIWKGGSKWWNLHQAKDVRGLAAAEVSGYRLAHKALGGRIPRLLYTSTDHDDNVNDDCYPWALLEYVGEKSDRFDGKSQIYDQYWTTNMIKIRHEFGFPEKHPRWGRVPVGECLSFTMRVLDQVTLPLHRYVFEHRKSIEPHEVRHLCPPADCDRGYSYNHMLKQYRKSLHIMQESLRKANGEPNNHDTRLADSISTLEACIQELEKEVVRPLPSVLLHSKFGKNYSSISVCSSDQWLFLPTNCSGLSTTKYCICQDP